MARLTDHDVRDAEDALRKELSLIFGRYARRLTESGKAYIQEEIESANREGLDVDGTSIGRAAAEHAARHYFGGLAGKPQSAIEGRATTARASEENLGLRHGDKPEGVA